LGDNLTGKVAIVTGAAQGIGRALSLGLAGEGATVVVADVNQHGAAETERAIVASGCRALAIELDVSSSSQVAAAMQTAHVTYGRLDILINNAAIFPRSPFLEMAEEEWDRVLAVNLKGGFLCARAAARIMVAQGQGGRIVNLTSGAAFMPSLNSAHYAASKGGVIALTRALALELSPHRITVNAIAPGVTDTAQPRMIYSDEDLAAIAQRVPLKRIAEVDDMVPAALFLCSDAAGYVTGQTLHVNGGLFMA
jgi:NAD(P)-dependent dehydrogenase (short-subunit alcohol dehydrogenase family)